MFAHLFLTHTQHAFCTTLQSKDLQGQTPTCPSIVGHNIPYYVWMLSRQYHNDSWAHVPDVFGLRRTGQEADAPDQHQGGQHRRGWMA